MGQVVLTHSQVQEIRRASAEAREQISTQVKMFASQYHAVCGSGWVGKAAVAGVNASDRVQSCANFINGRIADTEGQITRGEVHMSDVEFENQSALNKVNPEVTGFGGFAKL